MQPTIDNASMQPQKSAYLYSSSHLFNQKRLQAQKAYAKQQEERIKNFQEEFELDISESQSEYKGEKMKTEKYGNDGKISHSSQCSQLFASEQQQLEHMFDKLSELKGILKNCEQTHKRMKKTSMTKDDKQFLNKLLKQYGPPSALNKLNNIKTTISKIIDKISICQDNQSGIQAQKPTKNYNADASLLYDGKQEVEESISERKVEGSCQRSRSRIVRRVGDNDQKIGYSEIGDRSCAGHISHIDQSKSIYLQNLRSSRMPESNIPCSIAKKGDHIIEPKIKKKNKRYSQYEQETSEQRLKRSNSQKHRSQNLQNIRQCISPQTHRVKFEPSEERLTYRRNKKPSFNNVTLIKNKGQPNNNGQHYPEIQQFDDQCSQFEGDRAVLQRVKSDRIRPAEIQHEYYPSTTTNQNYSQLRNKNQKISIHKKVNNQSLTVINPQRQYGCPLLKILVNEIKQNSFVVTFNKMQMEIEYQLIRKAILKKNQIEIESNQIGNMALIFDTYKNYCKFYEMILGVATRN